MWVRGLKLGLLCRRLGRLYVAPYVGAWIETQSENDMGQNSPVAPYVGAWIETPSYRQN